MFTTYWGGYFKNTCQTLDQCPKYIDKVILAFIGPLPNSQVETTFLCSIYSKETIIEWIKKIKTNGTKVYMSLLDTPQTHWNTVDFNIFAKSLFNIMNEWCIDGFDIDAESGMSSNYVKSFVNLINCCYNINKNISYTCYTCSQYDSSILTQTKGKISFIQTMNYFDDYNGMITTYNFYKKFNQNVLIGVKAGLISDSGTPLTQVIKLCQNNFNIMLWTFNRDNPNYTNKPSWTWCKTIRNYIHR